jgi:hypothetical protein
MLFLSSGIEMNAIHYLFELPDFKINAINHTFHLLVKLTALLISKGRVGIGSI